MGDLYQQTTPAIVKNPDYEDPYVGTHIDEVDDTAAAVAME